MGTCEAKLSSEQRHAQAASKDIEQKAMAEFNHEKRTKKLLLLGAGESGKSTLFKQMITIYGEGYNIEKLHSYQPIIWSNIITSMKILIEATDSIASEIEGTKISEENFAIRDAILEADETEPLHETLAKNIYTLWNDIGIKKTYENRSKFQMPGSPDYFFDHAIRIGSKTYEPTYEDMLRTRVRTTGIIETEFVIEKGRFKMFDVGGQRNERKKQIHCFENVTAVLFVVAISEYDEKLFEDDSVKRMDEAMSLFDEICNSRQFRKTSMILFLNKVDLFKDKILRVPLKVQFDDYNGPEKDWESASEYIKNEFTSLNKSDKKQVYTHITCATDTTNVKYVMDAVTDIIIKQSLQQGGLLE